MGLSRVKTFGELIKYEHTVFALPFAYAGSFLAARGWPEGRVLFWVTVAMFGARSAAMALNRLIDWAIDARNPRTANRPLPQGLISVSEVLLFTLLSLVVFALAAWELNPLTFRLLPLALVTIVVYPYTKRLTWTSHLVLGLAEFYAPFGGWLAVTGRADPAAYILGLAVGLWIAAFDIIYALQDLDFDRREGLYSIPVRFGLVGALRISAAMHTVTVLLFLWFFFLSGRGIYFLAGVLLTALLLFYEHRLISPRDLSRLNLAFFDVNGYISLLFFCFTLLDTVLLH
ncbi:MAG: putative 4-hydroxybenzoate polyprenyltransferase [Firmicutes bacterium]|nr:putative 4-hydroxybenzoate polyprenyltransferase [Bacillota bacterium]MCL5039450.1 putative 4-hydroxybenzoate polyprenyltransferase [Bacillota bacterium]